MKTKSAFSQNLNAIDNKEVENTNPEKVPKTSKVEESAGYTNGWGLDWASNVPKQQAGTQQINTIIEKSDKKEVEEQSDRDEIQFNEPVYEKKPLEIPHFLK